MSEDRDRGLRERLANSSQDALGKLAQDLLDNPLIHGALRSAFEARERAAAAQEVAMGALNLPSAADLERLTRRIRSVSQRLEGIEDGVDRIDRSLSSARSAAATETAPDAAVEARLAAVETQLASIARTLGELAERLPGGESSVSPSQERLQVDASAAAAD